jgi:hypothetical protein
MMVHDGSQIFLGFGIGGSSVRWSSGGETCKMGAEEFPGVLRGLGWGRAATEQRCDEEEA